MLVKKLISKVIQVPKNKAKLYKKQKRTNTECPINFLKTGYFLVEIILKIQCSQGLTCPEFKHNKSYGLTLPGVTVRIASVKAITKVEFKVQCQEHSFKNEIVKK